MKYMLDTNIFNRVLDGKFCLSRFPKGSSFIATKIQFEELKRTPDATRKERLLGTFEEVNPVIVPPPFACDIAGAGPDEGCSTHGDAWHRLYAALEAIKPKMNNCHDALIAEAALLHGCGLATADANLAKVAGEYGLPVFLVK